MSGVVIDITWIRNGKVIPIIQTYINGVLYVRPLAERKEE